MRPGWVFVRVRAFGLNRAELITRSGGSGDDVKFPRVIGDRLRGRSTGPKRRRPERRSERVVAAMGEDGPRPTTAATSVGLLPANPRDTDARRRSTGPRLGAIPGRSAPPGARSREAARSLVPGDSLRPRRQARRWGWPRSRSRRTARPDRDRHHASGGKARGARNANGADHVVIDGGAVAAQVREIARGGVDRAPTSRWEPPRLPRLAARPWAAVAVPAWRATLQDEWDLDPGAGRGRAARRAPWPVYGSNVINRSRATSRVFPGIVGRRGGRDFIA